MTREIPPAGRLVLVVLLLLAVFGLELSTSTTSLGISLLGAAPVAAAALWFGRWAGLLTAAAAALLWLAAAALDDEDGLLGPFLLRAAIFTVVAYGLGLLSEQRRELRTRMARQERELEELRGIQDALAPSEPPARPALELATVYVPAERGVAGDFYLVAAGPRDTTVVVVGDVLGKGLDAARRASFVRAALASYAPFTDDPVNLLELANQSLIERAGTSQTFVTAACVVLRPSERELACALAGHPPPLVLDAAAELECGRPGVPLGLEQEVGATSSTSRVDPGMGFLVYTDGLLEARRPDGTGSLEQFGADRVREVLRDLRGAPPATVVADLRDAAERFAGGALPDDLCLVALRARV